MTDRYDAVRAALPDVMPAITRIEAQRAANRLWKHFTKDDTPRRVRRCWISRKPTSGHWRGWGRLVHDLSHQIFRRTYRSIRKRRPHDPLHVHYETEVAKYVVEHGWLEGKLAPPPPKKRVKVQPTRADKLANVELLMKRWESKRKRAETALKKLRRRRAALARHASADTFRPSLVINNSKREGTTHAG